MMAIDLGALASMAHSTKLIFVESGGSSETGCSERAQNFVQVVNDISTELVVSQPPDVSIRAFLSCLTVCGVEAVKAKRAMRDSHLVGGFLGHCSVRR